MDLKTIMPKGRKPDPEGHILYDSTCMKDPNKSVNGNRKTRCPGWEEGEGVGNNCLMDTGFTLE